MKIFIFSQNIVSNYDKYDNKTALIKQLYLKQLPSYCFSAASSEQQDESSEIQCKRILNINAYFMTIKSMKKLHELSIHTSKRKKAGHFLS